jgi:hypothetical protein
MLVVVVAWDQLAHHQPVQHVELVVTGWPR